MYPFENSKKQNCTLFKYQNSDLWPIRDKADVFEDFSTTMQQIKCERERKNCIIHTFVHEINGITNNNINTKRDDVNKQYNYRKSMKYIHTLIQFWKTITIIMKRQQ